MPLPPHLQLTSTKHILILLPVIATVSSEAAIRAENERNTLLSLTRMLKEATAANQGGHDNISLQEQEKLQTQLAKQIEIEKRERKVAQYARKELDNAELVLQRNADLVKDVESKVAAEQAKLEKITTKKLASDNSTIKRLEATRNEKVIVDFIF